VSDIPKSLANLIDECKVQSYCKGVMDYHS